MLDYDNSDIPDGLKCYELVEIIDYAKDEAVIKTCKYWRITGDDTCRCDFLGIECEIGDEEFGIWHREKECNVNVYDNVIKTEVYYDF